MKSFLLRNAAPNIPVISFINKQPPERERRAKIFSLSPDGISAPTQVAGWQYQHGSSWGPYAEGDDGCNLDPCQRPPDVVHGPHPT